MRANGFQIGAQKLGDRRGRGGHEDPRDPPAPFWRTLRFRARQIKSPRPSVSIDETEWAVLAGQINQDTRQNHVLEHVGEIAGMKGVAIVDLKRSSYSRAVGPS